MSARRMGYCACVMPARARKREREREREGERERERAPMGIENGAYYVAVYVYMRRFFDERVVYIYSL